MQLFFLFLNHKPIATWPAHERDAVVRSIHSVGRFTIDALARLWCQ